MSKEYIKKLHKERIEKLRIEYNRLDDIWTNAHFYPAKQ